MNFMISPFSEASSPMRAPEASSGASGGRKLSFSPQDHADHLSLPSLLYPYSSTPPPPPAILFPVPPAGGRQVSSAVTINVPVFSVEQVLQKMDRLYDATFSTWIKSEENVVVSTAHLKRISIEYSLGRILHGLVWLVQHWRLESIKTLIQGLWIDGFWTDHASAQAMSQTRINKIAMIRELLSSIRRRHAKSSAHRSALRCEDESERERPISAKEHAKCIEDLIAPWTHDQKFQFLFHYCTLQSLSYREGESQYAVAKWSLPEIFELVHHFVALPADFKGHLYYSIQLVVFMESGNFLLHAMALSSPPSGSCSKDRRLCRARRSREPKYAARWPPCEQRAAGCEEPWSCCQFGSQSIDIFSRSGLALLPTRAHAMLHPISSTAPPQSPTTPPRQGYLFSRPYLLPRIASSPRAGNNAPHHRPIQPMRHIRPARLPLSNPVPSRHSISHPWCNVS